MSWFNRSSGPAPKAAQAPTEFALPQQVLDVLPMPAFVMDASTQVVTGKSRSALKSGLIRGDRVTTPKLLKLVSKARDAVNPIDQEVVIERPTYEGGNLILQVRVAAVGHDKVLVLATDLTSERNVDAVRRDFVVNVSHELKTPVGALGLLAEAVLADVDDSDQVRHFAQRMELESARLSNLIGDIVELSRLQGEDVPTVFEPVRLSEVVDLAVDSVASAAEAKSIALVPIDPVDTVVEGSKSQLVTALRNLIGNAIAYSPENTRVAIGVEQENDMVALVVADQGQGIPAKDIDRIFERFYRVDQARSRASGGTGGTGLGLSIVKHITINHGGDISVRSVEGEGSTFTMRIRRHPDSPDQTYLREEI